MKIIDLIAELSALPENAIVYLPVTGDEILGDYHHPPVTGIEEEDALLGRSGTLKSTISNYVTTDDMPVRIYVLK